MNASENIYMNSPHREQCSRRGGLVNLTADVSIVELTNSSLSVACVLFSTLVAGSETRRASLRYTCSPWSQTLHYILDGSTELKSQVEKKKINCFLVKKIDVSHVSKAISEFFRESA